MLLNFSVLIATIVSNIVAQANINYIDNTHSQFTTHFPLAIEVARITDNPTSVI